MSYTLYVIRMSYMYYNLDINRGRLAIHSRGLLKQRIAVMSILRIPPTLARIFTSFWNNLRI